jgi:hypothetical protein
VYEEAPSLGVKWWLYDDDEEERRVPALGPNRWLHDDDQERIIPATLALKVDSQKVFKFEIEISRVGPSRPHRVSRPTLPTPTQQPSAQESGYVVHYHYCPLCGLRRKCSNPYCKDEVSFESYCSRHRPAQPGDPVETVDADNWLWEKSNGRLGEIARFIEGSWLSEVSNLWAEIQQYEKKIRMQQEASSLEVEKKRFGL